MCQYNETRCFVASKPKIVYKLVRKTSTGLRAVCSSLVYSEIGQKNPYISKALIRRTVDDYQPGYHCFVHKEDAERAKELNRMHKFHIAKCTIPVGAVYRFGIFSLGPTEHYKTLRSTDLIIDEILPNEPNGVVYSL